MFCRTVCVFIILYSYVNVVKSTTLSTDSIPKIQETYYSIRNESLHKVLSTLKNEKTRTTMKIARQAAAAIVNDDFDIPSDIDNHENRSEISVLNENEGSGIDEFSEEEASKTTTHETKLESQYIIRTDLTTVLTQSTTNGIKSALTSAENTKISTLTDGESSGDGIFLSTTESHETPEDTIQEIIPDVCLNSTCTVNDVSVFASPHRSVIAEGTNFTLSCKSNSSNHMLYWYKSNGSVYFLQTFGTVEELHLNVPDTKPIHSGKYMCVRWVDKQTCCNLESDLTVYELPLYKYHLIIIGLIAVVCLLICIFLSVRQVISLKMYTKQFVEKHGNGKKQQLL